jgi:hypothetical protein
MWSENKGRRVSGFASCPGWQAVSKKDKIKRLTKTGGNGINMLFMRELVFSKIALCINHNIMENNKFLPLSALFLGEKVRWPTAMGEGMGGE